MPTASERVRKCARAVARLLFTKDTATFLAFLCLAAVFWLMYNNSVHRTMAVEIPVKYVGVPPDVRLQQPLPETLVVTLKDAGKVLLNYKLATATDTLVVDLTDEFGGTSFLHIAFGERSAEMRTFLPETSQILSVKPEYCRVDFVHLERKMCPVRLSEPVPLVQPYVLLDSARIVPAFVEVFAPSDLLDTLSTVVATTDFIEPLSHSDKFRCPLQPIEGATFQPDAVQVDVPVELSTEMTLAIPVTGLHVPQGVSLRTFPATIQVTYAVGVSRYTAVNETDFSATVDYNDISQSTYNLPVTLQSKRNFVRISHFQPAEVEFLLEKE